MTVVAVLASASANSLPGIPLCSGVEGLYQLVRGLRSVVNYLKV